MNKTVIGAARMVQETTGDREINIEVSGNLINDIPLNQTFIGMQAEVLAYKLDIPVDDLLAMIKKNIKINPMTFN